MIQNIEPKTYVNHYDPEKKPSDGSYVIFFDNRKIFCRTGMGSLSFPTYGQLEDKRGLFIYLFSIDGEEFYLALEKQGVAKAPPAWEGWDLAPLFSLQRLQPKHLAFAALEASTLGAWYTGNRYCGRCGHEMVHSDTERALRCPECGSLIYPKICPVAIVGVRNGDKLLLTKYKGRPQVPFYALIAGFAEVGESIEDTVRREVMEETGVHVKNLRFYKSQPWALSDSLLMGFFCDLDGDEAPHADQTELSVAEWVDRKDIPNRDDGFSLTSEMIEYFRVNGKGDY